jgi:hypothetical protein
MGVSVAMATYNGERFLGEQLESLAQQTLPPDELVVGDDGSSDRTLDILTDFARTAPFPVRVSRNPERLGFTNNFLHTASRCAGELIAFCDQDDVWLPTKLERCTAPFANSGALLVIHQVRVVDERLQPLGTHCPDARTGRGIESGAGGPWLIVPGCAMLLAADLIRRFPWRKRPSDPANASGMVDHDEWVLVLAQALKGVVFLPEILGLYRQHGSNTCGAPKRGVLDTVRRTLAAGHSAYRYQCDVARGCADYLDEIARAEHTAARERLAGEAARYRSLARRSAMRAALYDPTGGPGGRLRAVERLLASGGYRPRSHGGLGLRSLAKDVVFAFLGAALRR